MARNAKEDQSTQMTVRAAAARLGVSTYTVQRLLGEGVLDGGWIVTAAGDRRRGVYETSLEAYEAARDQATTEPAA